MGFTVTGEPRASPLRGAKEGNIEFLAAFELVDPSAPLPGAPSGDNDADVADGDTGS